MTTDIIDILRESRDKHRPYAVATVIETVGSSSAKTGSKAVIDENGRIVFGWVGGGCAESMTCSQALKCIENGATAILEIDLNSEVLGAGMPCGGSMRVYVEPVFPKPVLWILGHGRVSECLCELGDMQGLDVIVIDRGVDQETYPAVQRLITDDPNYTQLKPRKSDFVVIATQHKGDHGSLMRALQSEARYIALIASTKRSRLVLDYLRKEGLSEEILQRVRAPAGIDLGAKTPEEIALSVMSEIVMTRRNGHLRFMSERLESSSQSDVGKQDASATKSTTGVSCSA